MALVIGLQHCPPDTVIQGVQIRWIWRPLVFSSEIWAVGLEPDLRDTSCVCWPAVLLEDVSTEQQSSAVVDKTGKETANVIRRIHFSALVNKVVSFVATKTHASRDHHMLHKLFHAQLLSQLSDVSFLAARRPPRLCCSGCWQEGLDKKNSRRWRKHVSSHEFWVDEAEFWMSFVHRLSYKVFERAEIARYQHCNADNFIIL